MLFISLPYYYHKANMFTNIIVLVSYNLFQTYNIMSCDASCDCSNMSFHCPRKEKEKEKEKEKIKRKIKSRKILVSKYTMTEV